MTASAAGDFGTRMKHAREARGVSLRDIATRTKISVPALEALERNDISRLPGGIFGRSFVRAYAEEVGLDPEQTIREFIDAFPHDTVTAGSPYVPAEDHTAVESSRRTAETVVKLLAIAVPVAIAILYFTLSGRNESAPVQTPPAVVQAPVPPPAPPPAAVEPAPLSIEIGATAPVSITLVADGVPEDPRTMIAGEHRTVAVDRGLSLTVSNAAALQVTINGQPAAPLGAAGETRTLQITRDTLASLLAPR